MNLIGIDLAWQSNKNTSAAAVGKLDDHVLSIHAIKDDLDSLDAIVNFVNAHSDVAGLAIDAPLIINNVAGQRACEKKLGSAYGARKAACHPANLTRYPDAPSVELANRLARQGFAHLGTPYQSGWQVECYPHPAIIEIFGLEERLFYKKGRVADRRQGQIRLAGMLRQLSQSPVLRLAIAPCFNDYLDEFSITSKRGHVLKQNEDALDAIVCTYIAGLYARNAASALYGDPGNGYIYVPQVLCL